MCGCFDESCFVFCLFPTLDPASQFCFRDLPFCGIFLLQQFFSIFPQDCPTAETTPEPINPLHLYHSWVHLWSSRTIYQWHRLVLWLQADSKLRHGRSASLSSFIMPLFSCVRDFCLVLCVERECVNPLRTGQPKVRY